MMRRRAFAWRATAGVAALLAALAIPCEAQVQDQDALIRLNRDLLEAVFLRQDTTLLAATALPNLTVVPPGGIVENRTQVLNGVSLVAMDSVRIDDVTVIGEEGTAVVIARATRLGPLPAAAGTGRSRIMSVFVRNGSEWRLLARSITPCIERAVAAARC